MDFFFYIETLLGKLELADKKSDDEVRDVISVH